MANAPIIGGFNALEDKQSANETTINLMQDTYEGKTKRRLRNTPGLRPWLSLPEYPIRGEVERSGRGFVAAGSHLYEVFQNGTYAVRGQIGNNGNPVSMDSNGFQLIIVDGELGWGMPLDTNILTPITSPNFYPTRTIFISDGYAVGVREGTQQFFHSDLYDVFTWIFSDFASAEINPDNLRVMVPDSVGIVALGDKSLEIFATTSDPVNVFQRRTGYKTSFGCLAPYTAINANNSVVWMGKDESGGGIIYRMAGGIPSVISTNAIVEAIQSAGDNAAKATAYTYQQSGHPFYCLNIPGSNTTYVYDFFEQQWHERRSYDEHYVWKRHKAETHMYIFNMNIVGSWDSGELFQYDLRYFKDGDLLIRRERTMTPIFDEENGGNYGKFNSFSLDCIVGEGLTDEPYDDPQISLETSEDNGISYGNIRLKPLGKRGQRKQQLTWNRCGLSVSRVFRVATMTPTPFAIHRAWIG